MARRVTNNSPEAQRALRPLGKEVRISTQAKELLEDFRQAACEFGNAKDAKEVEQKWVNMQMRMHELTVYVSVLENNVQQPRLAMLKF